MTRQEATELLRDSLDKYNLSDWHVRLTNDLNKPFLGLCSYKDKCIILNSHHIDIHPSEEVKDTILHEVAHALCPNEGHNEVWANKAKEIGCTNTLPCSHLSLSPDIIDAIRSGADVKIEFETETQTIRRPKYTITRLQDKCEYCGSIAEEESSFLVESPYPSAHKKFIKLKCGHTLVKLIPQGTPFHLLISNSDEQYVRDCKHEWNKNQCTLCNQYRPYEFQLEGMKFGEQALNVNKGVLIADEMGLGKTIQALGIVKFCTTGPTLYIVKSGLKFQWSKQILIWLGPEYVPQIFESSNDYIIPNLKSYIIGYDMLVPKTRKSSLGKTIKQGFDITRLEFISNIVLDECQQIKNPDSSRTQQVRKLAKDKKVIPLSGTPWKNRGSEFYSALNMIAPVKFPSYAGFKRQWVETIWDGNKSKEGGIRNIPAFKDYISDIAIRRERTEVMSELPLINRMKLYCNLSTIEQATYNDEVSAFVKWYNQYIIDGTEDQIQSLDILAKLARMRHITGLAKIPQTIEFVNEFLEETERKLVVFVHHKDVGSIIYDELAKEHGKLVLKLTADMSGEERFRIQELFNATPKCILIGSTLAMGEGLNLQTCADCVMHERQWNPANEEQAEGRFIRIGQQAINVNATYVEAEGTVDEILDGIIERKRVMFHESMNNTQLGGWNQGDVIKEVAESIVKKFNMSNKAKTAKLVKVG